MPRNLRTTLIVAIPVVVLLLPVAAFAVDRVSASGEVPRNVSAAGIPLGGLDREDAVAALQDYELRLATDPAVFEVVGTELTLRGTDVGLEIDEAAIVDEAMEQRRDGGILGQFFGWFGSFSDSIDLDVPVTLDGDLLDDVLTRWEDRVIGDKGDPGGVDVDGVTPIARYPKPGQAIDRAAASELVSATLTRLDRLPVDLPVVRVDPVLQDADVDAALAEARLLLDAQVTLLSDDPPVTATFGIDDLADAFRSETTASGIDLSFDPDTIEAILEPMRSRIEQAPENASFRINEGGSITIVESRRGTRLDTDLVADALYQAALTSDRGEFPFAPGPEPDFSTEDAAAMGPLVEEGGFTTYHPTGQPRVTNIHTFADTVDGAIVWPGETFSLNEHVGERTVDKGYVPAPMILDGEIVDDVGGGVSQFATTFYNAVFFSCYEDVEHQPHSYYFSRYPEVREATISWPSPNLVFRNDSDAVVIIDTSYTADSITVTFYGNNGGRECEAALSDRFAFTDPKVIYQPDASLPPTETVVEQEGFGGWSATATRIMTYADGTVVEQPDTHTYVPQDRIVRTHPCNIPAGFEGHTGQPCPVRIPDVISTGPGISRARIEGTGLVYVIGPPVQVTPESGQNGIVVEQTPPAGQWVAPGTTVIVRFGETPPPAPDPDPGDGGGEGDGDGDDGGGGGG